MRRIRRQRGGGYVFGDVLVLSSDPADVRVRASSADRVFVEWPWRTRDPSSHAWDGTLGFQRDPDHWEWRNTPWRLEPDPAGLNAGDLCMVGIPTTEVQVIAIDEYDPPADFGWLPRPVWGIGVCPISDLNDDEAGYVIYLDAGDPIEITPVRSSGSRFGPR